MTRATKKSATNQLPAVAGEVLPPATIDDTKYPLMKELKGASTKNVGKDADGRVIPHKRTQRIADLVSRLVACGATEGDIAIQLNIRPGQLRQHYGKELDNGAFPHNMEVASAILTKAKDGDLNAGIYWTKTRMNWRDGEKQQTNSMFNIHIHT